MTITDMDVVYVITSSSLEMTVTPGDLLAAELARQGKTRADLAKDLGVNWPTVDRWIKNDGFAQKNRVNAALVMGLQPDAFEVPEHTVVHRLKCEEVLEAYLASPRALPEITEVEKATLRSVQIPLDSVPTELFYNGLLMLLRGYLTPADLAKELEFNEGLSRSVGEKMKQIEDIARMFEQNRKEMAERRKKKRDGGEK